MRRQLRGRTNTTDLAATGALDTVYLIAYSSGEAYRVHATDAFLAWIRALDDSRVRTAIFARINRLSRGNLGDSVSVGGGVFELRIHAGPGYRVYFARLEKRLMVLLAGGHKRTQAADIRRAQELLREAQREEDA